MAKNLFYKNYCEIKTLLMQRNDELLSKGCVKRRQAEEMGWLLRVPLSPGYSGWMPSTYSSRSSGDSDIFGLLGHLHS